MVCLKSIVLSGKKPEIEDHRCHSEMQNSRCRKNWSVVIQIGKGRGTDYKGDKGTLGEDGNIFFLPWLWWVLHDWIHCQKLV